MCRRRRTTARPARSFPWMSPTTSTVLSPCPRVSARIGVPCTEVPTLSAARTTANIVWHPNPVDSAIVVGAGTFGASLAWQLARDTVAVTLIDQFEPGDPRATSGGETRLY